MNSREEHVELINSRWEKKEWCFVFHTRAKKSVSGEFWKNKINNNWLIARQVKLIWVLIIVEYSDEIFISKFLVIMAEFTIIILIQTMIIISRPLVILITIWLQ